MRDRKKDRVISNNIFAIKWLFKIAPVYTTYRVLMGIINDVCVLVEHTFLVAYIISCIENGKGLNDVLLLFVPVTLLIIFRMLLFPYISAYVRPKAMEKINKDIKLKLYNKAVGMDIEKYDNADFYNDFVWAMQDAPSHMSGALDTFINFLSTVVMTLIVGVYVVFADVAGLFFIIITVIVTFICRMKLNQRQMKRDEEMVPQRRKRDYVNRVFYLADFAKDLKTSQISEKLYTDYKNASVDMQETVTKHSKKLILLEYITNILQRVLTFDGVYLSWLLYQIFVLNAFGYGTLIALYNSSGKLKSSIDSFVETIPRFQQHSMYIEKLRSFLESENLLKDNGVHIVPQSGNILLDNITFSYPGSDKSTINRISMQINKGDKIALVGHNGAGKSTLVKLLMRLYDPQGGRILYDDNLLTEYPLKEYRNRFGTVFQEHEIIAATLGENITMSTEVLDEDRARETFDKVGFIEKFNSLADAFDTPMTKEFDSAGVNLSGGEAQKIALARVLYSDASVLIFDEPSSALDPIAEYQLNRTILDIARDKTVIIITHRLSTTRFADKIYMLENGSVVETGTHDELIGQNGKYAEMFNLQAEKYR